jgi:enamine deaminase RidA (YjgF/YER057c/UK114 family)
VALTTACRTSTRPPRTGSCSRPARARSTPKGRVVAPGDFEAQARQAVDNLLQALAAAGAGRDELLRTTIYVVGEQRSDLVRVWDVVPERLGRTPSTLLGVSLLGYPDQLVEDEAIARAGSA